MSRTLADLANDLKARADNLPKATTNARAKIAFAIIKNLIQVTPVDTSNALSNWQISLGQPAQNARGPYVPGYLGYTAAASQAQAIAAAQAMLEKVQPGQSIWISNLAPYIVDLNNGSSKQAPAGFVERAQLIGSKILREIKLEL
jgi:hypothetical protein